MTDSETVTQRRRELYRKIMKGKPVSHAAQELAEKYDVKPGTIRNDWYNHRHEWLKKVYNFENKKSLIDDIIAEKKETKGELWDIVEEINKEEMDDKDYNALIRAIESLNRTNDKLVDTFQSTGEVDKEPEKHEVSIEVKDKVVGKEEE